jgi:glucosamine-6-phosphate deaminase
MIQAKSLSILKEGLVRSFHADLLNIYVYQSRKEMGAAAAAAAAFEISRLIEDHGRAIGIFAAGASENQFIENLVKMPGIEWTRVIGFHPAEYLGMDEDAPRSLRKYLIDRLVKKVPIAEFHGLRGEAANPQAVCENYAALLKSRPPDFAAIGIGENGQLALIDPPECDFNDPAPVRVVELDESCRREQVSDGAFATVEEVPRRAISLTIPSIIRCPRLLIVVDGLRKQQAVRNTVEGEITTACPASILRKHPDAHLFLDVEAAAICNSDLAS